MHNLLDPAILFFIFGALAGAVKSNLEIPPPISRFLALYLLMALGLKGGFALAHSGFTAQVATSLGCAVLLAVAVPLLGYWGSKPNAAKTYGVKTTPSRMTSKSIGLPLSRKA